MLLTKFSGRECLRPIVRGSVITPSRSTLSVGAAGDTSVATGSTTIWIGTWSQAAVLNSSNIVTGVDTTVGYGVGATVDDGGVSIPLGTTIIAILSATSFQMSAAATASGADTLTIVDKNYSITSAGGNWAWLYNLFASFNFPSAASFFVAYLGTTQSGTLTMTIQLLDASSAVLTSAVMSVAYMVDLTTFLGFNYTVTPTVAVYGAELLPSFNGVKIRWDCSNTNLSQLLDYGPIGGNSNASAYLVYPLPSITVRPGAVFG